MEKFHEYLCILTVYVYYCNECLSLCLFVCLTILLSTTTTTTTILQLSGLCPWQPGWATTSRNIHPLTPIVAINHPSSASSIFYDLWHPPCSIYKPDKSFSTISLQVFFGLPLGLAPSTSYLIHFFTQSLSSFRSTCSYHHNLFCFVIKTNRNSLWVVHQGQNMQSMIDLFGLELVSLLIKKLDGIDGDSFSV